MTLQRRSRAPSTVLLVIVILFAGGSYGGWRYWRRRVMERNEAVAAGCLKILTVAEVDFRSNDRDGNRINDFWTADVAGLHSHSPFGPVGEEGLGLLVNQEMALADGTRPDARPHSGYFFRAMDLDENGNPYREETHPPGIRTKNMLKFGFCAYPAVYGRTGRWTYIVNEVNTIFKVDTGGQPILRFPADRNPPPHILGGARD